MDLGVPFEEILFSHEGTVRVQNLPACLATPDEMPLIAILWLTRLSSLGRPTGVHCRGGDIPF
jgi:hypothetical protein